MLPLPSIDSTPISPPITSTIRRAIVACLADRPQAVGELAAGLPVSRSAVSQHLKVLKDAGLVSDEADGTRRVARVVVLC